jgi:hypothetical protein
MPFVTRRTLGPVLTIIGVLALSMPASASNQSLGGDDTLPILIQNLRLPDWETRSDAFFKIVGPVEDNPPLTNALNHGKPLQPIIQQALIDLLWLESKREEVAADEISKGNFEHAMNEDQSEYWAALTSAVGALHNPAALDVLLTPTVLKNGANNISAIGSFGEPFLGKLLIKYGESLDLDYRSRLLAIFSYMLDRRLVLAPANRERLRWILLRASESPYDVLRLGSLKGLLLIGDTSSVQRVREIATDDPFSTINNSADRTYPVRIEAGRELHKYGYELK